MKYIIFDIDGTLTNTTEIDDSCYIRSFESLFNVSISDVNWGQMKHVTDWGITEELIVSKLNRKAEKDDILSLKSLFLSELQSAFKQDKSQFGEIKGALSFYSSLLKYKEFKIGIATGGWKETANLKLEAIGIDPDQVSYSNSSIYKERENILLDVMDQLDSRSSSKPNEIIYFGDGVWDYKTCMNIGIRFIGIDSKQNGKLRKLGAQEVFQNFEDSELILKSINKQS